MVNYVHQGGSWILAHQDALCLGKYIKPLFLTATWKLYYNVNNIVKTPMIDIAYQPFFFNFKSPNTVGRFQIFQLSAILYHRYPVSSGHFNEIVGPATRLSSLFFPFVVSTPKQKAFPLSFNQIMAYMTSPHPLLLCLRVSYVYMFLI